MTISRSATDKQSEPRTSRENIKFFAGQGVKRRYVRLEILRDDLLRDVSEPICEKECSALVEVTAVEDQQELYTARIGAGRLETVRLT